MVEMFTGRVQLDRQGREVPAAQMQNHQAQRQPPQVFRGEQIVMDPNASAVGAAFRDLNFFSAAHRLATRPSFRPDEEFNPLLAIAKTPITYGQERRFMRAESQEEFDHLVDQARREALDRAVVQQAGGRGLMYSIAAGLASPTTLLPIFGLAGAASRGATITTRAGLVSANSALAVALDEMMLQESQVTRTMEESALSILAGAMLGGTLGGAVGLYERQALRRVQRSIEEIAKGEDAAVQQLIREVEEVSARGLIAPEGRWSPNEDEIFDIMRQAEEGIPGLERQRLSGIEMPADRPVAGPLQVGIGAQTTSRIAYAGDMAPAHFIPEQYWSAAMEYPAAALRGIGRLVEDTGYQATGRYISRFGDRVGAFRPDVMRRLGLWSPALGPTYRATVAEYPLRTPAALQQNLATAGGFRVKGDVDPDSAFGLKTPLGEGGPLEGLIRSKERRYDTEIVKTINEMYAKHIGLPEDGFARMSQAEVMSVISAFQRDTPERLTMDSLGRELALELNMPGSSTRPEVVEAAQRLRDGVLSEIAELAQRAGLWPEELDPALLKGALGYFPWVYNEQIKKRGPIFARMLVANHEARMREAWTKRMEQLTQERNAIDARVRAREMADEDAATVTARRKEIDEEIKQLETQGRPVEEVAALVRSAREMTTRAKELDDRLYGPGAGQLSADEQLALRRQISKLREDAREARYLAKMQRMQDPTIDQFKETKRRLQQEKKWLGEGLGKLVERQNKALADADAISHRMQTDLTRASRKINELMDELDSLTNENWAQWQRGAVEEIRRLEDVIAKAEDEMLGAATRAPELVDMPEEWVRRLQRFKKDLFGRGPDGDLPAEWLRVGPGGHQQVEIRTKAHQDEFVSLLRFAKQTGNWTEGQAKALQKWADEVAALPFTAESKIAAAQEKFDRAMMRALNAQVRGDRIVDWLQTGSPEQARQGLVKLLDDFTFKFNEQAKARTRREDRLRERAHHIGLEEFDNWHREHDTMRARMGEIDRELEAGFQFDAEAAFDDAYNIISKLQGAHVRTPAADVIIGERGPELKRMLDIPYNYQLEVDGQVHQFRDFLVEEPVKVLRALVRTVVPDAEISIRLGEGQGPGMANWLDRQTGKVRQEYSRMQERIEKDLDWQGNPLPAKRTREEKDVLQAQLAKDYKANVRDLTVIINRLKHLDGIPNDPAGFWGRAEATWRSAQVALYMGMVAISSISELVSPMLRYGMRNVFNDSYVPLIRDTQSWMKSAKDAMDAGQGLDPWHNTRLTAFSDISEANLQHTQFEKVVKWLSLKTGTVALFDRMTQLSKMIAAPAATGQLMRAVETVMTGKGARMASGNMSRNEAIEILQRAGFSDQSLARFWHQVEKHGAERRKSGFLDPRFDLWDDQDALQMYRTWMSTELDSTTVTPGAERPAIMTSSAAGRIIAQFRSFTVGSHYKLLHPLMQDKQPERLAGILMMLAAGQLSYTGWAISQGTDSRAWQEYTNASGERSFGEVFAQHLDEALWRSGVMFGFSEPQQILSRMNWSHDWVNFSSRGATRIGERNLADGALGVSMSTTGRMTTLFGGLDAWTESTTNAARSLTFYNNVWWLRRVHREFFEVINRVLDIPEDRRELMRRREEQENDG